MKFDYGVGDTVTLTDHWRGDKNYDQQLTVTRIESGLYCGRWYDQHGNGHNYNGCWKKVEAVPW